MQFVEVKHIATNDVTIVSREWVGGSCGTIVFIHGLGADQRQFESDASFFSGQGYNVVTLDLRGHGSSSIPWPSSRETLTVKAMAEDLLPLLDRVLQRPLHLVGNSLGGLVALKLIDMRPDQVTSLTTLGTAYSLRLPKIVSVFGYWFGKLIGQKRFGQVIAKTATRNKPARTLLAKMYEQPNLTLIQIIHRNVCAYNYIGIAKAFTGPVLMVGGERDMVINALADRSVRAFMEDPKFCNVRIANAGHFINLDQPEKLREALITFWNKTK